MKLEDRTAKCGCVICICNDEEQCQGCGATSCKDFPDCQVQDLHVIGTCGECEHKKCCAVYDILEMGGYSQEDLKTFGCIHFEQKEGS